MTDIETATKDFHNILCRYKEKQHQILFDAFNNICVCDGCHLARIQAVQGKMFWSRQVKYIYPTILAVLIILIWLLRSFNHASIFGSCSIFFLWPFDECSVAY